jgi:hypothetical protein
MTQVGQLNTTRLLLRVKWIKSHCLKHTDPARTEGVAPGSHEGLLRREMKPTYEYGTRVVPLRARNGR